MMNTLRTCVDCNFLINSFWCLLWECICKSRQIATDGRLERNGWRAHRAREEGNSYFRSECLECQLLTEPPGLPPYLSPFPIFESLSEPLSQPQTLITQNFSDHWAPLPHMIIIAHCHPTINTQTHTHIEVTTLRLDPPYKRQSDRQTIATPGRHS